MGDPPSDLGASQAVDIVPLPVSVTGRFIGGDGTSEIQTSEDILIRRHPNRERSTSLHVKAITHAGRHKVFTLPPLLLFHSSSSSYSSLSFHSSFSSLSYFKS